MGGCRCTFRGCENGTASRKELHYFRYPVRDPHRLKVWARNADRLDFLELANDKLANKVVCQEHFERMMFMNDLRDRLTKLAIPRLMPMRDNSILNVETNEIHWEYINGSVEDLPLEGLASCSEQTTPQTPTTIETITEPVPAAESPFKKIKILNLHSMIGNKPFTPCEIVRIKTGCTKNGAEKLQRVTPRAGTIMNISRSPQTKAPETTTIDLDLLDDDTDASSMTVKDMIVEEDYLYHDAQLSEPVAIHLPSANEQSNEHGVAVTSVSQTIPIIDPIMKEKLEQNAREIEELKKLVKQLVDRPTMVVPPTKVVMEKGPQLTKAQLFNGIKRYLNPTMVTLLRMELFAGATDRQWKSDEKTLSVDMLNMGEQVYDMFTDEFRFRLPAKRDAQQWKDSDELDADDAC